MEIGLKNITFRYQEARNPVFTQLSARLSLKGFNAFFGLSGSGKSTLARLIAGLESPCSGSIEMARGASSSRGILYSWNGERLPGWQRIIDHLHRVTPEESYGLLDELTKQFGIEDLLLHRFSRLSMGQKNRVNLVRYLVQDSGLLIMDEVLANVDEPMRHHILACIKRTFPDRDIVYIAHSAAEVAAFAARVFILPQPGEEGISSIMEAEGLDLGEIQEIDQRTQELIRQKSMELLEKASSSTLLNPFAQGQTSRPAVRIEGRDGL